MTYDLRYKDPQGVEWLAAAKDQTDGASIPPWAQPFVGKSFDKSFTRAAVIHDHYCKLHVRPWQATHRVFYDALIESGVDRAKAKLMYFAVYLRGPKWVELIPGTPCGSNCLFKVEINVPGLADNAIVGRTLMTRPAIYDEPGFMKELKDVEALIAEEGDKVNLDFLERRAERLRPNDFYYKHGSRALAGGVAVE